MPDPADQSTVAPWPAIFAETKPYGPLSLKREGGSVYSYAADGRLVGVTTDACHEFICAAMAKEGESDD